MMWYLFGVVRRGTPIICEPVDFNSPSASPVPVQAFPYGDIVAVAAALPAWTVDESHRGDVLLKLVVHQRTLEQLMKSGVVLPIRFGTVVDSVEDIEMLLHRHCLALRQALTDIDGKIEAQLSVTWDIASELRAIAQSDLEVQAMKRHAGDDSVIEVGRVLDRKLDARRAEAAVRILDRLRGAYDTHVEYDHPIDSAVFCSAFLIPADQAERFDALVRECDREFGGALHFRLLMPLPPQSFRTVIVRKISPRTLDNAMRLFDVNADTTLERLKEKNRELMRQLHPDRVLDASGESFAKVHSAFVLLKTFFDFDNKPFAEIDRDHCLLASLTGVLQIPEMHPQ